MIERKKILIILYKYVPEIAPRVFRWRSIVKEWSDNKVDIDLICAAFPNTPQEEICDNVHIYRIIPWFKKKQLVQGKENNSPTSRNKASLLINKIKKSPKTNNVKENSDDTSKSITFQDKLKKYWQLIYHPQANENGESVTVKLLLGKLVDKLRNLLRKILRSAKQRVRKINQFFKKNIRSYLWPDYGMPWIPPVYFKARKLIRRNRYSAIITVSWPVSPHVVGSLLHKTVGKRIPWLVDIGDPFSFNKLTQINDFKKYGKLNHKFETNLLRDASILSVTTQETKNDYLKLYPAAESKIVVIPPIIPTKSEAPLDLIDIGLSDNSKKNLIFTGSLRRINRRPDSLLKLFSCLLSYEDFSNDVELHFYGDIKQCVDSFRPYEDLINEQIYIHGIVEKEVVDIALSRADFLVNIGNVSENQLPSKLVEYLASNHPIINIASNNNDSSWGFLSSTGIALNVLAPTPQDITPEVVKSVSNFLRKPPRPLTNKELNDLTYPYLPKTISKQYLDLIKAQKNIY